MASLDKRRSETMKVPNLKFQNLKTKISTINEETRNEQKITAIEEKIKKFHKFYYDLKIKLKMQLQSDEMQNDYYPP